MRTTSFVETVYIDSQKVTVCIIISPMGGDLRVDDATTSRIKLIGRVGIKRVLANLCAIDPSRIGAKKD